MLRTGRNTVHMETVQRDQVLRDGFRQMLTILPLGMTNEITMTWTLGSSALLVQFCTCGLFFFFDTFRSALNLKQCNDELTT